MEFVGLPSQIAAGEVVQCTARIKNTGSAVLKSLRMLSSHPDFLCLPSQLSLGQPLDSVTGLKLSLTSSPPASSLSSNLALALEIPPTSTVLTKRMDQHTPKAYGRPILCVSVWVEGEGVFRFRHVGHTSLSGLGHRLKKSA